MIPLIKIIGKFPKTFWKKSSFPIFSIVTGTFSLMLTLKLVKLLINLHNSCYQTAGDKTCLTIDNVQSIHQLQRMTDKETTMNEL